MEKSATLNLRVNPTVKKNAEAVLSQLGIPMSVAVDMFLNQISLTGGIPFTVSLPKAPNSVNADLMSDAELCARIEAGYKDAVEGREMNAAEAFKLFREKNNI